MDCDSTFFIEADDDDEDTSSEIQSDCHLKSNQPPLARWIKNNKHYVLVLRGDQLRYELQSKGQLTSDCEFRIQTYKRTKGDKEQGRVIRLYTTKDDKYKVVCCDKQGHFSKGMWG